jgi:hypothetical protein
MDLADGKRMKGIFHTATPFPDFRRFNVAVRAAREIKVTSGHNVISVLI